VLIAARVGSTRLIDNIAVTLGQSPDERLAPEPGGS